jgi:hypothetical protein
VILLKLVKRDSVPTLPWLGQNFRVEVGAAAEVG